MMCMKKYLFLLLAMLTLASCAGNGGKNKQRTLTVTIEPLRYFTETIAGDKFNVVSMVPEGSNPETYDPTPQQLVKLAKSTAYLRIGHIGFEQAWIKKLQANTPNLPFYDMSEGIDLIHEINGHTHGNNEDRHTHGVEPHIWNSTRNASILAENICKVLCEIDSVNKPYYQQRLDSLQKEIQTTDKEVQELMVHADQAFLIYHPALSYFAKDYGLKQISIEEGGKEPSPAHLQELIRTCRENQVRIIFVQQEFDVRNAELIAKELGVQVVSINPLSYHWKEEMLKVARALSNPDKNSDV